jgi:hypothetical protein
MKYNNIREEALKNKVGADWIEAVYTTEILGNIDFTMFQKEPFNSFMKGRRERINQI